MATSHKGESAVSEGFQPEKRAHSNFNVAAFLSGLTLAWVVLIWTFRFLPMEDYPLWLYGAKVAALQFQGHPLPGFTLLHWPIPNSAFVALVGILDFWLPPEISGKVFLTACVILYCLGAYQLVRSMTSKRNSALFILPMLYVFHRTFLAGELSCSLGMGILLIAMAFALRASRPSFAAICGISITLFFCHAIPYICWLILVFTLIVFDSTRFPRLRTALATAPSMVLVALYALHGGVPHHAGPRHDFLGAFREVPRFWSLFSPLHFFSPFFVNDPRWLKVAALAFNAYSVVSVLLLIGIWCWKLPGRLRNESASIKAALITALIFLILFVAAPFETFTGVFDLNYRFLLPAFILILATLVPVLPEVRGSRVAVVFSVLLVVAFQFYYTARTNTATEKTYALLAHSNLGADFRDITHGPFEPRAPESDTGSRFMLPAQEGFYTFAAYIRLEHLWPGPMFTTSFVVRDTDYPPLLGNTNPRFVWPREIVILGLQKQNREIAEVLPARYQVAADTEYLMILKALGETEPPKRQKSLSD